jgi:hypothetical protein
LTVAIGVVPDEHFDLTDTFVCGRDDRAVTGSSAARFRCGCRPLSGGSHRPRFDRPSGRSEVGQRGNAHETDSG